MLFSFEVNDLFFKICYSFYVLHKPLTKSENSKKKKIIIIITQISIITNDTIPNIDYKITE